VDKIENTIIDEKIYTCKLDNGLTIMVIPKKDFTSKYVIWATHYGSIDNCFVLPDENKEIKVPDGIAHFLEHKLFEQENGVNSLDALTNLGASANAYTSFNHTAYLFETTDNFYECLDEFMDYVQNPYFTDENVEKEKGIIGQEIHIGDDSPEWQLYFNFLKAAYHNFPVKIDIAGTQESISKIDKEVLYKCYNTFYNPSNMVIAFAGDFNENDIVEEVKKRLKPTKRQAEIKRIFEDEPIEVKDKKVEKNMEVSLPLFLLGYKIVPETDDIIKRHVAIEILLELIVGKSSKTYHDLYEQGLIISEFGLDYDFEKKYAHLTIEGQSKAPEEVINKIKSKIQEYKQNGINKKDYNRIKKMLHGEYIKQFDSVDKVARMFISDYFKGINSLDYLDAYENIEQDYVENVLNEIFKENNEVISIINPN